jgi:WD40-like Beta Propeller Repeat.
VCKGQVNSLSRKITPTTTTGFTEDISGDGRFAVMVSQSNLTTVAGTRNNVDGNYEVFLFDYAQRHVFQITNTKSLLINPAGPTTDPNIRIQLYNLDVKISNDGRWIVFSSNATTSRPNAPNQTNPGNFDANAYTDPQGNNPMTQDGNMEIWLYKLPDFPTVDLSSGIAPAFVDLSAGMFTLVTNTNAMALPSGINVSFDNIEGMINDNGCVVAFTSVHDLMPGFNIDQNREIYIHEREDSTNVCQNVPGIAQVTRTPNLITSPIFNASPSLSGNGRRLAFVSSANNPVIGMTSGSNPEFNAEVFYTDLDDAGSPVGIKLQVTDTIPPNPTVTMNLLTTGGRRMSRDGRFIALESRAQLGLPQGGTTQSTYALFLYDADAPENQRFRQVGPRPADDPALGTTNPDVRREPVFSDYDQNGLPAKLLFTTRTNFRADGTVPPNPAEGLNPNSIRQGQIYSYQIGSGPAVFSRLTNPATTDFAPCVVASGIAYCARPPIAANTSRRVIYTEPLNGNLNDRFFVAALYLFTPQVTTVVAPGDFTLSFKTGGSSMTVGTALPDALGLAPNMLASATLISNYTPSVPITTATGVSITRNFSAPIELRGTSISIDGFAARVTANVNGRIDFIVPDEVSTGLKTLTINHNGFVFQGTVNIIRAQPDILTTQTCPCTASARARILNVTNPAAPQTEPFTVTTQTPNGPQPTRLRLFVTGVRGVLANELTIRIGQVIVPTSSILTNATQADYPGVYTFDFTLPQENYRAWAMSQSS